MNRLVLLCAMGVGAVLSVPVFAADEAALQKGKVVYDQWCAPCHAPRMPGMVALMVKYNNTKPALVDERTDLPPAAIKLFVRKGISIMPPFRKTEISDAELDVLAAYVARKNGAK